MLDNTKLKITDWAEEDRPREKMLLKGISALSDAELLAILIGSGNRNETAVELSQRILHWVNNDLNTLGKLSIKDLTKTFNGIGEAKAITIAAALELGKRRKYFETQNVQQIISSKDVFNIFQPIMCDLNHEECWIILLNRANKIIKKSQVSKGGITGTIVDIRVIIKESLENLATGVILVHNHPSENLKPSNDDNLLTEKLNNACKLFDIILFDHLIVSCKDYYSYKDNNTLH